MTETLSPIWPATLHHLRLNSDQPKRLVDFYKDAIGLEAEARGDGVWQLTGPDRRMLIGHGDPASLGFAAFALAAPEQLAALRAHLAAQALQPAPSPSPLFEPEAFAVADPDGNQLVFGLPPVTEEPAAAGSPLKGRLQHFVVASTRVPAMVEFYRDKLGMLVSDYVHDDKGDVTACFLRSDPEHHCFAVFRAPKAGLDHHSYETSGWMDIRDWADRMGDLRVPLWWGPGRHGVGNNLFFMVEDPDGSKVELSAELEVCPADQPPGEWEHGERALNLWGNAWMRS